MLLVSSGKTCLILFIKHSLNFTTVSYSMCIIHSFFAPQEIDDLLSGSLTQEDEDAVLQELEEMTQVVWHICCKQFCRIQ